MADANSLTFWSEVAARYKDDGRVMFELYNEPHDVSWDVWKSGGNAERRLARRRDAAALRRCSRDRRGEPGDHRRPRLGLRSLGRPGDRIDGYNIVYATHPYNNAGRRPHDWDSVVGLPHRRPIRSSSPSSATRRRRLRDGLQRGSSFDTPTRTAPAGPPGRGSPADATFRRSSTTGRRPLGVGAVVKAALLGYGDPPASPPGARVPQVHYTFDHGTEGWALNHSDDPNVTNLGAGAPDGGALPTLGFAEADGDPSPGALRLTVSFTDGGQYALADVSFAPPGLDLSEKTLHARVRLVSGTFAGGSVALHACTAGVAYVCTASPGLDAASLAAGVWAPVVLDLGAATPAGFQATATLELGVRFLSGVASEGDTVFEIDTVTD